MKKIELHLHLEGAAPPTFIRGLAAEKRRPPPRIFSEDGTYRFDGFRDFLRVYEEAAALIETPQDYARLVTIALENCAENGAVYAELFIAPDLCGRGDPEAWRDCLAAMEEAAAKMSAAGIDSRAVVTAIRHFDPVQSRRAAICAAEASGGWVAGFGLSGAETVGLPGDFAWAFDCAREAGLGLTCHAGEFCGPHSIREALDLGVTRIGHGIRAVEDKTLMQDLANAEITLECCPGSNIALGLCRDWASHPVARLLDAGIRVTISTDDPPFFGTSLQKEYDRLAASFDWGEAEFRQINQWAIDAAFCDKGVKDRLRKDIG